MTTPNNIPCGICAFDPTKKVLWSKEIVLQFKWKSGNLVGTNSKGRYGWKYRKYKQSFMHVLETYLNAHPVRPAKVRRRVFLQRLLGKGQRTYDDDNHRLGAKPLRDCLTEVGLIVDDRDFTSEFVYVPDERDTEGIARVKIILQELAHD